MSSVTETLDYLRARIMSLSGVTTRPVFGNEAFFAGKVMFAAFAGRSVVLHLPQHRLTEALRAGHAKPFVSLGATSRNQWVEVPLTVPIETITEMLKSAYEARVHSPARVARRPPRARHVRTTAKR
jgi:hypothetical protein